MYIKILLNYLLGYVNIVVEGFLVEHFINICINRNIFLWKVKRDKSTIIYAKLSVRDFKNAVKIAKQTKCRIKIKSKKGIPFLLNRYKKRKIILGLLICIFSSIIILSNFIWNIEVTGTENIDKNELIEFVQKEGLAIGKRKSKINLRDIVDKIRLERKDIAWVRNRNKRNKCRSKSCRSRFKTRNH